MAKELVYRVRIDYDASEAAKGGQAIDRSQEQAEKAVNQTTSALRKQQQAQETVSKSARGYNRVQSNANQTLFTFGDLLNDTQQFQYSFAQGTRAIGNNIGFAAEQFSQISQRTGSFKGTLKALGSSLLGPGGAILAINAAVTAITVFGDELFDVKEITEEANEEIDQMIGMLKEIGELTGDDNAADQLVDSIRTLERQQARLNQRLRTNKKIINEIGLSTEELNRLKELRNLRDQVGIDLTAEQFRELQQLSRLQKQGARAGVEGYRQENERLQEEIEKLQQEEEDQRRKLKEVAEENRNTAQAVEVARFEYVKLTDAIDKSSNSMEEFLSKSTGDLPKTAPDPGIQAARGSIEDLQMRIRAFQNMRAKLDPEGEGFQELTGLINARQKELENFKRTEEQKTQIARIASAQRSQIFTNAITVSADLIGQAFNQSKEMAIAQTLISTYASAQKAYESQLAIPTPDAPARAAAAAAIAIAQGLARLAAIRSTQMGSGGGGGGQTGGGQQSIQQGFQTSEVQRNGRERITGAVQSRNNNPNIIVEANNILPDTEFSARAERGKKERITRTRTARRV